MQISAITFSIEKTTPLEPVTGNPDDRYANVKPAATVTVQIDRGDDLPVAWDWARNECFEQLVKFHEDLLAAVHAK